MILILHILDFESRKHKIFQLNWPISFQDITFLINLICKFQNVPWQLGFEIQRSKFLY